VTALRLAIPGNAISGHITKWIIVKLAYVKGHQMSNRREMACRWQQQVA